MSFTGNVISFVGGILFDKLGPGYLDRMHGHLGGSNMVGPTGSGYPACIGGLGMTVAYCLLGIAVSANISYFGLPAATPSPGHCHGVSLCGGGRGACSEDLRYMTRVHPPHGPNAGLAALECTEGAYTYIHLHR